MTVLLCLIYARGQLREWAEGAGLAGYPDLISTLYLLFNNTLTGIAVMICILKKLLSVDSIVSLVVKSLSLLWDDKK
jgi:hypothetical protein